MTLVVLHGPPASGKLTVARELSRLTKFKVFHNHLTVDMLLPVFDFRTPSFSRLREEIWLSVMSEAARTNVDGIIFTFAPERSVSTGFLSRLANEIESLGGSVCLVELQCHEHDLEKRMINATRKEFGKLQSVELYRELRAQNFFTLPGMPASDLVIDTSHCTAQQSAEAIAAMLNSSSRR